MSIPVHSWIPSVALEGRVVRLELLEARNAPDLLAAFDAELYRHMVGAPPEMTLAGFERDIERMRALPTDIPYAIVLRSTGLAIGRTWVGRAWHGKGVNPEAKYLMLRHVFETTSPPAHRVAFWTNVTNQHSQGAMTKLGATREGLLRRIAADPQRPEMIPNDIVVYSIIAEEWPGVKATRPRIP